MFPPLAREATLSIHFPVCCTKENYKIEISRKQKESRFSQTIVLLRKRKREFIDMEKENRDSRIALRVKNEKKEE